MIILRFSFLFLGLSILTFFNAFAGKSGINFSNNSWATVREEAKSQGKFIFVDFYADWCGPCKYMSSKIFTDPDVADFYNSNFISFKVDAEKQEKGLVEEMQLTAYPTLVFFDPSGKLMLKYVGVLEKEEMLETGKQIFNYSKNEKAVLEGTPDTKILKDYLLILKEKDFKKAADIARNYLADVSDSELASDKNWFFIHNFAYNYNTREFAYIVNHPSDFIKYQEFQKYYQNGAKTLMIDAVEQKDYEKVLLHKKYHVQVYKAMGLLRMPEGYYSSLIDVMYYDGINDSVNYFDSLKEWIDTYNKNSPQALVEAAVKVSEKLTDENSLETALSWSETAIKLQENYSARFARSAVLKALGRKKEAIEEANKAKAICSDAEVVKYLDEYIKALN